MPFRSSTIFLFSAISTCLVLPLMVAAQGPLQQSSPVVKQAVHHDVSPPLFLIPPPPRQPGLRIHDIEPIPRRYQAAAVDPVLQQSYPTPLAPVTTLNFDGVGNGFTGPSGTFTVQSAPPDTEGDVGPNHYVQIVNTDFAIFNKSGTPIFGPVPINTLWQGFGGFCATDNDGDPVVIYDPIADRWVISQFAVSGANGTSVPFLQCVAVSQTADPTGAYNRYSFAYNAFNDYPKMGVWPDAYYTTFNFFNSAGTAFLGGEVCAYDRMSMLAGQAATQQCFNVGVNYGGLLAADLDGAQLPPAGSPNYVLALGVSNNDLAFWKFHVDWATPANTTLTGPITLTVATYTAACNGGTCIPQAGTSQMLDSLADRLMYRLAYRNFGSHESLVANHSVSAGSGGGVRWYEIRSPGTTPTIFQQGTYAPDSNFRWMGSIAMDQSGNMALGFSLSSSSVHPEIHFTGRLAGDPLGQMTQGEGTIINGAGSQTANLNRWGDYSMMGIDPSDDCTFWYTNEYLKTSGTFNWSTRIASFQLPNCGVPPTPDFSLSTTPSSVTVTAGSPASYTENITATGGFTGSVSLSISGLPAGASGTFNPNPATGASSALTVTTSSTTPAGSYVFTVTGTSTSPALTHTSTATLVVQSPPTPDFSLSTTPSSVTVTAGSPASYTENITATGGFTGSVSLSISGLPAGASGTFNPNPATGASSALTVTTSSTTPAGSYVFTVTGTSTSPALTHTSTATLVVQSPPDFSLSTAPSSMTVTAGSPASYIENITRTGGFTGSVTLSISGLPAGASGTFNPNPATGASSALTVTTSSTTPAGSYVFTVTGTSTSPALTHTSTATLVVQSVLPPPPIAFVRAANNLIPVSATSVSVANMINNASDMLVVACRESAQITITSVTDTAGNGYTKIATALSTGRESALFFAANIKASSGNTISCNFASSTGREAIVVEEFSGVVALDGSVTASNNSPTTNLPSGNLTTTNANDLLVYEVNVGADSTFTAGPGYTIPPGGSNARLAMQFTTVSSQGTYSTSESWSTVAPADGIFAALK